MFARIHFQNGQSWRACMMPPHYKLPVNTNKIQIDYTVTFQMANMVERKLDYHICDSIMISIPAERRMKRKRRRSRGRVVDRPGREWRDGGRNLAEWLEKQVALFPNVRQATPCSDSFRRLARRNVRRRGGLETLHVATARELKSRPSTSSLTRANVTFKPE